MITALSLLPPLPPQLQTGQVIQIPQVQLWEQTVNTRSTIYFLVLYMDKLKYGNFDLNKF